MSEGRVEQRTEGRDRRFHKRIVLSATMNTGERVDQERTHQTELDASLARTLAITLFRSAGAGAEEGADLAFGRMAVETALGCPVSPPLPVDDERTHIC